MNRPERGKCLDENAVAALFGGYLTPEERARVQRHADLCTDCRQMLAAMAVHNPEPRASTSPSPEPLPASTPSPELSPQSRPHALEEGTKIEHFRIMRLLGRGVMGEVYLARDTRLGRRVALKLLSKRLLYSEAALARFEVEARATAKFRHPNIVTIHAVGRWQNIPLAQRGNCVGTPIRFLLWHSHQRQASSLPVGATRRFGCGIRRRDRRSASS